MGKRTWWDVTRAMDGHGGLALATADDHVRAPLSHLLATQPAKSTQELGPGHVLVLGGRGLGARAARRPPEISEGFDCDCTEHVREPFFEL